VLRTALAPTAEPAGRVQFGYPNMTAVEDSYAEIRARRQLIPPLRGAPSARGVDGSWRRKTLPLRLRSSRLAEIRALLVTLPTRSVVEQAFELFCFLQQLIIEPAHARELLLN